MLATYMLHSTTDVFAIADGIKSDNVGNRLLKSMGWQEGKGLGRHQQGIVDPIKAEQRVQGAGLGMPTVQRRGADAAAGGVVDYKQSLLANMRDRYYQLQDNEK